MGQDATKSRNDVKTAFAAIPAPPPYLQKDFGAFKLAVSALQGELDKAVDSDLVAKARKDFKEKKPGYDTLKGQLQGFKNTVNTAVPGQKAAVSRAKGKIGDVNKAAAQLINALKGKTGKDAELSKQVVKFANVAATVQGTDDPKTIDDAL